MKTDKLFNATYSFFIGAGLTFLGIVVLIGRKWLYINLVNVFLIAIFILSLRQILNYFLGREKDKKVNFVRSMFNLLLCLVFSLFKNIPISFLPIMFGIYLLLNSTIKFINFFIIFFSKSNGFLKEIVIGILYLLVGIPCILSPIKNLDNILILIGIYVLLLGITYTFDSIRFVIPIRIKNRIKSNIRITLPSFVEAIIPYFVLKEINYSIDKDNYDNIIESSDKKEEKPDIEVFVHISNRGYNRLGHVDLCYKNKVYAFGGYDDDSLRFHMMIADGVLIESSIKNYIPFCIEHSKKTIFAFGLKLTEKQKRNLDKVFDNLYKESYRWYSPYEVALKENKRMKKDTNMEIYKDYASRLYQVCKPKYYKFKKGKFKKFFVVGNSCCNLVNYLLGKNGIDILDMYGVITPGAYYEYLNREFHMKNSIVISRKIYNSKNVDKRKVQEIFKGFSK